MKKRGIAAAIAAALIVCGMSAASVAADMTSADLTIGAKIQPGTIGADGQLLPAGGTVIAPDTYSYDGGDVILNVVPDTLAALTTACPDGWLCLYFDAAWQGTMLQFQSEVWQNLSDWGANDKISSWSNHKDKITTLSWDANGGGAHFHMDAHTHGSSMGSWNDQASAVHG
jgi:hypothetical protein